MSNIAVSIICNTYNQEKYIADALESFVMQKTNFEYEILVHDDASTDKTADVVREYEAKYPGLIKPIYQTENQYSKGGGLVGQIQRKRAVGKYIAFCEGDDYWTDPLKLQKQYDALEAHPEIDICAHCGMMVEAQTKKCKGYISPSDKDEVLSMEQVILGGGAYVVTNSLMYRRELTFNTPKFREFLKMDYTMQMHGAMRGGMLYLADCMSAYRVMAEGSWSVRISKSKEYYVSWQKKIKGALELLNEETEFKYDDAIKKRLLIEEFELERNWNDAKYLKAEKYKEIYKNLPAIERIKINIKLYFPQIVNLRNKVKGKH